MNDSIKLGKVFFILYIISDIYFKSLKSMAERQKCIDLTDQDKDRINKVLNEGFS